MCEPADRAFTLTTSRRGRARITHSSRVTSTEGETEAQREGMTHSRSSSKPSWLAGGGGGAAASIARRPA